MQAVVIREYDIAHCVKEDQKQIIFEVTLQTIVFTFLITNGFR